MKRTEPLEELMTFAEASAILRLDHTTIRKRLAGTERLTHVRQGHGKRQRVCLIRSEVEQHLRDLIEHARAQQRHSYDLVWGNVKGGKR